MAIMKTILAIIFAFSGMLGSLKLKVDGIISEPSFVVFVAFSILAGLLIAFVDRIEKFSLRNLEMTLREVKQTEASVKEVARAILEVIEARNHSLMLESFDQKALDTAVEKLKKLIA